MPCLYHMVPPNMFGHVLYPLNRLKDIAPHIYEKEIAKYRDRPNRVTLPERLIPKMGCKWNDVLHFSPVHPNIVYRAWVSEGATPDPSMRWFQIDIVSIGQAPIALYKYSRDNVGAEFPDDEVIILNTTEYQELSELPQATREWYRHLWAQRRMGGYFHRVPHVLVKGTVDVSGARIINWGDTPG